MCLVPTNPTNPEARQDLQDLRAAYAVEGALFERLGGQQTCSLVMTNIAMGKITMFFMGQVTMSMDIFKSYFDITRGYAPFDQAMSANQAT